MKSYAHYRDCKKNVMDTTIYMSILWSFLSETDVSIHLKPPDTYVINHLSDISDYK